MFSLIDGLTLSFLGNIGYMEIFWLAIIILLVFGSARLPSLMRNMGRSINEFKAGMQDKPAAGNIEGKKEDE